MSEMVITLLRVRCDEVTDDFLEGLTDEFGWRLTVYDMDGRSTITEAIPMPGLEAVSAGSDHTVDGEIGRLGPQVQEAWLEFWDQDTFSENDLLGRIEIRRDGAGRLRASASLSAAQLEDGSFHLTGEQGDYTVWLRFDQS